MNRALVLIAALIGLALVGPASAQQQQQDPFNGQFGVVSIVPPPAEAARLAKLMGDSLNALQPQRPGVEDVYLITASLWSDPVFEREATQSEEILRQRFHAEGRSIILSAGGQGQRNYPAATPDNISAAIGQVGQLIDPNEDLVIIFITSHGAHDGTTALREYNRLGASMRGTNLADMLRIAGIRNRVVIVSACFSGAFIAPLMDDNTIVLTAAAPDRSSFGCQPQRDWTFFGDAYFNHAVRGGAGLVPAFDQAKTLIEQWEHEQHMTPPSNPQRYVGAHAAEMLRQAERNGASAANGR
jgi:Peptidase C13 family